MLDTQHEPAPKQRELMRCCCSWQRHNTATRAHHSSVPGLNTTASPSCNRARWPGSTTPIATASSTSIFPIMGRALSRITASASHALMRTPLLPGALSCWWAVQSENPTALTCTCATPYTSARTLPPHTHAPPTAVQSRTCTMSLGHTFSPVSPSSSRHETFVK